MMVLGALLGFGDLVIRGERLPRRPATSAGATICAEADPSQPEIQWISADAALDSHEQRGVVFVDVRAEDEFQAGHVSGALHLALPPTGQFRASSLALLRQAHTVIAYSDTEDLCARSRQVASLLSQAGLRDVRVLQGGMPEWLRRGYPAEAGMCKICL